MSAREDEILTVAEASRLLSISEATVYALAGKRELPACKVGREWRFVKSQLLDWIKTRAAETAENIDRMALESMEDGMAVLDRNLKIVRCNDSYLRLKDVTSDQVVGEYCYRAWHASDAACPESICPVIQAFRARKSAKMMHTYYDARGKVHYLDVVAFPMKKKDQTVSRVVEVVRDNTELYELNQHLNWVVGFVAHELKGTLGTVVMNISALVDKDLSKTIAADRKSEMLLGSLSNLKLMHDMIRNYLLSSRAKAGQIQFNLTTVDAERDVLEPALIALEPVLCKKRMKVVRRITGSTVVSCDKELMKIVINNLINNAIKYGTAGTEILCHLRGDKSTLQVSVLNEGIGIPHDKLEEIFGEFTRCDPLGIGGTGIGLFLIRRIVEMHGGSIVAQSGYLINGNAVPYASLIANRDKYGVREGEEVDLPKFAEFTLTIPSTSRASEKKGLEGS